MSHDPKRLRESEGEGKAVALVEALAGVEPTSAMRERVWAKIALALPPPPGSAPPPGGGASAGGGGGGAGLGAKLAAPAIVALGAGAIAIAITFAAAAPDRGASSPAPSSPPSVAALPPPTPAASAVYAEPLPAIEPAAGRSSAEAASAARPPREVRPPPAPSARASAEAPALDRLREEAEGVRRARQLLREKDPAAALAELRRLDTAVPNGPLGEEREVLAIEALAASGEGDAARRRAERFLFERPQSVHAPRIRALAGR